MNIQEFVDALNAKFKEEGYSQFEIAEGGVKYTKIIGIHGGSRSSYCFIDKDGNIYKAASWKVPAKGIRSTLATVDISKVDKFGSWLYRR